MMSPATRRRRCSPDLVYGWVPIGLDQSTLTDAERDIVFISSELAALIPHGIAYPAGVVTDSSALVTVSGGTTGARRP